MNGKGKPILVIGGGIAGMTAAIEAAETGCEAILIEKSPSLGGRVARMNQYFPKLCPPACGLEINFKRIKNNPRISVLTQATLESLTGTPGDYEATVAIAPRYVSESCTACGACTDACPAERPDEFEYGLAKTKAAYLPHAMAFPAWYAIDRTVCPPDCHACVDACKYGAIDLNQQAEHMTFQVAAVIAATGWAPYDAARIGILGFGKYKNVVTNLMFERMAARDGATQGRILRPSDGKEPSSVAFVQCAGSRDENHLPYCSTVCCTASLKQSTYVRAQYPDAAVTVFYIDIRTPGVLEEFFTRVKKDDKLRLVKGKVAKVEEDAATGDLLITAEDALSGKKSTERVSLLVLATGVVPQTAGLPPGFSLDEYGFIKNGAGQSGLYSAGCARRPSEVSATVRDSTGAALKALQCVVRSAHNA
jgi:quinone-modifying oxidoreductase subunit QmoA